MRWALAFLALACLATAACSSSFAAVGGNGTLYWSLTINNTGTAPSDGLVLIITYGDGSTATVDVPPGGMVVVPVNGGTVLVRGAGGAWTVAPDGSGNGYLSLPMAAG